MFGLIYAAIMGVGTIISGTKNALYDMDARERGRQRQKDGENFIGVYYDRRGAMRSLADDKYVSTERNYITGDLYANGVNYSEKWRRLFYEEKKENPEPGRTVVNDIEPRINPASSMIKWEKNFTTKYFCAGQWYKDLETGRLLVERQVEWSRYHYVYFYMDIITRKFVRISDQQVEREKENPSELGLIEKLMEEHNKKVDEWNPSEDDKKKVYFGWDRYYFNYDSCYNDEKSFEELKMMGEVAPRHPLR